jgi:2',3'-cyclic-nucleotide 2'-phosphodiesterase/3'-nucleotidase
MIETAKKWVPIIKEKEKPDLIIGLFHSGVNPTYNGENANTYKNENASKLVAQQVPGFDVVFVGHDHAGWNFKTTNINGDSVLIVGTLARAKTIAVANIQMVFDSTNGHWNKENVSSEIIETKNYKPDQKFLNKFIRNLNVVENYVQKPLGQITKTISSKESFFGPSEFIDLIQKAQLELTGADISFASPLSSNTVVDSGWIRVRDMFKLYHYENFLYTMSLSGKEIKDYLEYSFGNWFNQMKDENDHLLKFKYDKNGELKYSEWSGSPELDERYYNFSSAAGINYTVDVSKPSGERVNITTLSNGVPFNSDSTYIVAINSYRGSGGGGHLTRGAHIPKEELSKRVIRSTEKDLRFYLMKWIEEKKTITPKIIGNWKVVPDNYWETGKEKDFNLLYGKNRSSETNNKY